MYGKARREGGQNLAHTNEGALKDFRWLKNIKNKKLHSSARYRRHYNPAE